MIRRVLMVLSVLLLIASGLLWIGSWIGNPRFANYNSEDKTVQIVEAQQGRLYVIRHSSLEEFYDVAPAGYAWFWERESGYVYLGLGKGYFSVMTDYSGTAGGRFDGRDYSYPLPIYAFVLVFGAYPAASLVLLVATRVQRRRTTADSV
ncbi:MAG: hypothetical protein JSV78_09145 [Phycisphaerales bacterium]|nr:MAG: hypothetical protein JSV78_09145 [Phycisphaerales bacterium]